MKKLMITAVVLAVTTLAAGNVYAARRPCRTYAPASVQAAPVATAQTQPGYRAFSYQPTTGVVVQPTYRARPAQPAYFNAGRKILGQY